MSIKKLFAEHKIVIPDSLTEQELQKAINAEIAKQEQIKQEAIQRCRLKENAILQSAMERLTAYIKADLEKRDLLNGCNITFTAEFGQFGLKVTSRGNTVLTDKTYFVNSDGLFSSIQETCNTPYDFRQARKLHGM